MAVAAGDPNLLTMTKTLRLTGDVSKVKDYLRKLVQVTKEGVENGKETGCLHYDFHFNVDQSICHCRSHFSSAADLCNHLDNVEDVGHELLSSGLVTFEGCELIGAKDVIRDQKLVAKMAPYNPTYFTQM